MTDREVEHLVFAVQTIVRRIEEWGADYRYNSATNSWLHNAATGETEDGIRELFAL
jgi:hypothetical protein